MEDDRDFSLVPLVETQKLVGLTEGDSGYGNFSLGNAGRRAVFEALYLVIITM